MRPFSHVTLLAAWGRADRILALFLRSDACAGLLGGATATR
eukprot:COSAG01_NODE_29203_length_642_cov_52.235727_1_plen_40_part_10